VTASDFIKSRIEPVMRRALAELCAGIDFRQRTMPIRWKAEGIGSFEFDAVSADGRVIACLSTARNLNPGQRHKLRRDATFMWLVPDVQRRILAVVEPKVAAALAGELRRGRLPPNTEIHIIELAPEIRQELVRFREKAVTEVGGRWMVKVCRFKTFDGRTGEYVASTRMATREKIESSKTFVLIEGTEAEIDSARLIPGEHWTAENFTP
jgi:hypothetical protein